VLEGAVGLFARAHSDARTLLERKLFGNTLAGLEAARREILADAVPRADLGALREESALLGVYMSEHDPFQLRATANRRFLELVVAFGVVLADLIIFGAVGVVVAVGSATIERRRRSEAGASARPARPRALGGAAAAGLAIAILALIGPSAVLAWRGSTAAAGLDLSPFFRHVRFMLTPAVLLLAGLPAVVAWRACTSAERDAVYARFLSEATTLIVGGLVTLLVAGVGIPLGRERAAFEARLERAMSDEVGFALERVRR
jgi:hypothetical protein